MAGRQTTGKTICGIRGEKGLPALWHRSASDNRSLETRSPVFSQKPGFLHFTLAVRVICGGLLLSAAALKAHAWVIGVPAPDSLFSNRWAVLGLIELELLLAMLLMFAPGGGRVAQGTWLAALIFFGTAGGVSLSKALAGAESCGCFGAWQVSPWVTSALDLAAVAGIAMVGWRKQADAGRPTVWAHPIPRLLLLLVFLLPGPLLAGMERSRTRLQADGTIAGEGGTVVLRPATWVGRQFPLASHIDLANRVNRGSWLVVLFRHNCQRCQTLLEQLARYVQRSETIRIVLIEVPPFGKGAIETRFPSRIVYGRLSESYTWTVTTPVLLKLNGGRVTARYANLAAALADE